MVVVDHEPQSWFLLEEDGDLYLDGNYSASFVGYVYPVKLSLVEAERYRQEGRAAINRLVEAIGNSAPILGESRSAYKGRLVPPDVASRLHAAILAWKEEAGG